MFRHLLDDETELRILEVRHADALYAVIDANRAHLRRWLPWVETTNSADDIRSFIRGALREYAEGNGFTAGIWRRGEVVGVIGLRLVNWAHRSAAIGYWLAEAHQGRGIMTRACRALVDHAFDEVGLNRVEIRCATENTRSQAIPVRLGFTFEGTIRQAELLPQGYVDHFVYGLLARDWNQSTNVE